MSWRACTRGETGARGVFSIAFHHFFFLFNICIVVYTLWSDNGLKEAGRVVGRLGRLAVPHVQQCRDAHVQGTAVVGKEVTYRRRRSRAPLQYSHPSPTFFLPVPRKAVRLR